MNNKFIFQKLLPILLIISVLVNITLAILFINTTNNYKNEHLLEVLSDTISASDNTIQILTFYKTQLELETISSNDYSAELKELSDIHASLISLISEEDFNKKVTLQEKTIKFLTERKKMLDNLKSAIDLDSSNYYNVATQVEKDANATLQELNNLIKQNN